MALRRYLATQRASQMVSIDLELEAAKAAQAAIEVLLTTTFNSTVVKTLRKANQAAILNLSSGGALNEARGNVGIALSNLIHGPPTPEKIEKAKGAVEEWLKRLASRGPE